MNKISTKNLDELAAIGSEVGTLFDDLDELREKFEAEAAVILERIAEAKGEARDIMDEAANDAESYYDERSEKWQEGDRGQAYSEWKDRLRSVAEAIEEDLDAPEVQMPERPSWVDELREPDFSEFEY